MHNRQARAIKKEGEIIQNSSNLTKILYSNGVTITGDKIGMILYVTQLDDGDCVLLLLFLLCIMTIIIPEQ